MVVEKTEEKKKETSFTDDAKVEKGILLLFINYPALLSARTVLPVYSKNRHLG